MINRLKYLGIIALFLQYPLIGHTSSENSLNDVLLLLNGKDIVSSSSNQYQCSELECNDPGIHKKNPYGLLSNRLQEKIDDYLKQLGTSPLDAKFLSWLESQTKSCLLKNELPDDIRTQNTIKEARSLYEKQLLNKSLPATEEEKKLLLMNNPVFPLRYIYGGLNLGIPESSAELKFKAYSLKDTELLKRAESISDKIKLLQKQIYNSNPEVIPHLTLNLVESIDKGCNFHAGQIHLIEKGFTSSLIPYKEEDKQLVQKMTQNCGVISSFPDVWKLIPKNTYPAFDNGEFINLILKNMKSLDRETKTSKLAKPNKALKVEWNYDDGKIVKKSIDEVIVLKPYPLSQLAKAGSLPEDQIKRYLDALRSRKELFQDMNERLAKVLSSPEIVKQVKNITDESINLQKNIEEKEANTNDQIRDIFGLQPKNEMKDWFDCNKRTALLKKQYAEFQVMSELMNSSESVRRRENVISKAKKLVSDSIDRMKISDEAKIKMHERLSDIAFDDEAKGLPNKAKIESVLDQFIQTKDELVKNKTFDNDNLHTNLAEAFDPLVLGVGQWSSMTETNAFYSKESHSMRLLGPLLLPEASENHELTLLKVLTHEMGHGLDENLPCLHSEKYKIPADDSKVIKNLEICATPGKFVEDYADNISNDAIGFYIQNNLANLEGEKKAHFINEIKSFYCSPKDLLGDTHSSDKMRSTRLLSHPYFKSILQEAKIQTTTSNDSSCEGKVWAGY